MSLVSSAIPFHSKQTKNILPANWKMIVFMNRYLRFLSKGFFKKLSNKITKQLDRTIEQSIREMVEADRLIANQPPIKIRITLGAQEAYQNNGLAVFYDALAMMERIELSPTPTSYKVFIWQGDQDNVWTVNTSEYLRSNYTNSQMQIVDGQAHLLYLSHWNNILEKALQS